MQRLAHPLALFLAAIAIGIACSVASLSITSTKLDEAPLSSNNVEMPRGTPAGAKFIELVVVRQRGWPLAIDESYSYSGGRNKLRSVHTHSLAAAIGNTLYFAAIIWLLLLVATSSQRNRRLADPEE